MYGTISCVISNKPRILSPHPSPKSSRFRDLRTLQLSLRSFFASRRLFSATCGLFLQNTRGGYPNTSAPSFAPAVICATWRLYPLWSQSIAHTSRHHGGVRVCVATRLDAAPILAGEEERGMANFLEYNPEQAYLLPPTVREVLGEGHLCFFVHGAVE